MYKGRGKKSNLVSTTEVKRSSLQAYVIVIKNSVILGQIQVDPINCTFAHLPTLIKGNWETNEKIGRFYY